MGKRQVRRLRRQEGLRVPPTKRKVRSAGPIHRAAHQGDP